MSGLRSLRRAEPSERTAAPIGPIRRPDTIRPPKPPFERDIAIAPVLDAFSQKYEKVVQPDRRYLIFDLRKGREKLTQIN